MKIIDRYVLLTFLKNYVLSMMILLGLYVVLDMLFNFNALMSIQDKEHLTSMESVVVVMRNSADYYFYQVFLYYVQLSGIIPVVAAAFTLMRMSRFNELSALLSSGVPLLRVTVPVVLASVVFNGLLLADQELIIPGMIPKLVRGHDDVGQPEASDHFAIPALEDDSGRLLVAARYVPGPDAPMMYNINVIERNDKLQAVSLLTADQAVWDASRHWWDLTGGKIVRGLLPLPGQTTTVQSYTGPYRGGVTPQEIALYRNSQSMNLLSTESINSLLARQRQAGVGVNRLLRVKNFRFAQPIVNVIVLLLAIPCVLTRNPGRLHLAALRCLLLTGLCLGTVFACQLLASTSPRGPWLQTWPAIMAWTPIFIFGPLAVWLLDRVES